MKHLWRRFRPRKSPKVESESSSLLTQLLERTPGAVRAQRDMDAQKHTYHTNKTRLFELIDFNDTFVSLALSLQPYERDGYIDRLKVKMSAYCEQFGSPMFTDEQFDAITKGLSREVAVYLAAQELGYGVTMTSRAQDAMGVDMVITDSRTGVSLNIDCKASSAFRYRVKDLVSQGRVSEEEAARADAEGYVDETNGKGSEAVHVTVLRIDPNETGDIRDFTFTQLDMFKAMIERVFASHMLKEVA